MRRRPKLTEEKFDREAAAIKGGILAAVGPDAYLSADERAATQKARAGLLPFTRYTFPGYDANWHHEAVCHHLDNWVSGATPRLMLFMPPRHGKSELGSRRLPARIFGEFPDAQIIATSYAAELAKRMNRDVQRIMSSSLYKRLYPHARLSASNVRSNSQGSYLRNSDMFEIVGRKGSYRAAGVGGGITGMGADFAIIDDPIKNRQDANSKTFRDMVWEWYTSTLYTRLEKNGRVLVILTRWHEDDLAGRLLKRAKEDPEADQWQVVNYPAISEGAEGDRWDKRTAGEALWPAKYNEKKLAKTRKTIGSMDWASLYQGNPKPLEGGMIKMAWFDHTRYDAEPFEFVQIVQSWDTAKKAKEANDFSVCTTWGVTPNRIYLLDVYRKRMEFPELERAVDSLYHKFKPSAVLIEDKSSGTSLIQTVRNNSLIPVIPVLPDADKQTRMMIQTPKLESGMVWLPKSASWLHDFETEIENFPNVSHDDQVDSMSQFLTWVQPLIPLAYGGAEPETRQRTADADRPNRTDESEPERGAMSRARGLVRGWMRGRR